MLTGISLFAGVFLSILSHPLHLSISNVEYTGTNGVWEVSIKLFQDDFGDELTKRYGIDSDFNSPDRPIDSISYKSYVKDNFELRINNSLLSVGEWKYAGKKVNFEAVWLNFTFNFEERPKSVTIENTLMFDLFDDQKNLLIFTFDDQQKSFQFRHNKPKHRFVIE